MTEGPRKPEQASLGSELNPGELDSEGQIHSQDEPSGIDSIPLIQESHEFPEERDQTAAADESVETAEPEGEVDVVAGPSAQESPAQAILIAEPPAPELAPDASVDVPSADAEEGDGGEEAVGQLAFDDPGFDEVQPALDDPEPAREDWDNDATGMDLAAAPAIAETPLPTRFPQQWIVAGLSDLAVNLAVVALGALAVRQLGIPVQSSGWPGYLGFALSFSFLYTSMPLAFWGQTPGMALFGLRAADGDQQLSFGQTALRWLAAGLTLGTLGLPWFLARSGRPLADRLSRSETLVWQEPED